MTNPRPPQGPALSGAVDLSGLKQRAQRGDTGPGSGVRAGTEVSEANFEAEVLAKSARVPVVVVLWSPRSDVCVQFAEMMGEFAAADDGKWSLALVDVETAPRVAQIFGVEGIPTVVAVAAGRPITSFNGPQPPDQLRRWLDSLLSAVAGKLSGDAESSGADESDPVDPALLAARQQMESGDYGAARASFQALLDADPDNTGPHHAEATMSLRQVSFLERATGQRPDAVEVADASPRDVRAALAAADVQVLHRDVSGAFRRLTGLIAETSADERTTVRTRLLELFELFDPADPQVIAARRDLANALY